MIKRMALWALRRALKLLGEDDQVQQVVQTVKQVEEGLKEQARIEMVKSMGAIEAVKNFVLFVVSAGGSLGMTITLASAQGYLFAGFQPFSDKTYLTYIAAYLWELTALSCYFKSNSFLRENNTRAAALSFTAGLILMSVSVLSQFAVLEHQYVVGDVTLNDASLQSLPVVNMIVSLFPGLTGHELMFVLRGIGFHVIEIFCVFLMPVEKVDIEKTIQKEMKETWGEAQRKMMQILMQGFSNTNEIMNASMGVFVQKIKQDGERLLALDTTQEPREERVEQVHARIHFDVPPVITSASFESVIHEPNGERSDEGYHPLEKETVNDVKKEEVDQPIPFTASSTTGSLEERWGWGEKHSGIPSCEQEAKDALLYRDAHGKLPPHFKARVLRDFLS